MTLSVPRQPTPRRDSAARALMPPKSSSLTMFGCLSFDSVEVSRWKYSFVVGSSGCPFTNLIATCEPEALVEVDGLVDLPRPRRRQSQEAARTCCRRSPSCPSRCSDEYTVCRSSSSHRRTTGQALSLTTNQRRPVPHDAQQPFVQPAHPSAIGGGFECPGEPRRTFAAVEH